MEVLHIEGLTQETIPVVLLRDPQDHRYGLHSEEHDGSRRPGNINVRTLVPDSVRSQHYVLTRCCPVLDTSVVEDPFYTLLLMMILLKQNKKRREPRIKKCHTKTMMSITTDRTPK